jgi:hypothetical protein
MKELAERLRSEGKVVATYPIHLADWILSGESDLTGIDCLILYGSISPDVRVKAAKLPVTVYLVSA